MKNTFKERETHLDKLYKYIDFAEKTKAISTWDKHCCVPASAFSLFLKIYEKEYDKKIDILTTSRLMAGLFAWKENNYNVISVSDSERDMILNNDFADVCARVNIEHLFSKIGFGTYLDINLDLEIEEVVGMIVYFDDEKDGSLYLNCEALCRSYLHNNIELKHFSMKLIDGLDAEMCLELMFSDIEEELEEGLQNKVVNISNVKMIKNKKILGGILMLHEFLFVDLIYILNDLDMIKR